MLGEKIKKQKEEEEEKASFTLAGAQDKRSPCCEVQLGRRIQDAI